MDLHTPSLMYLCAKTPMVFHNRNHDNLSSKLADCVVFCRLDVLQLAYNSMNYLITGFSGRRPRWCLLKAFPTMPVLLPSWQIVWRQSGPKISQGKGISLVFACWVMTVVWLWLLFDAAFWFLLVVIKEGNVDYWITLSYELVSPALEDGFSAVSAWESWYFCGTQAL